LGIRPKCRKWLLSRTLLLASILENQYFDTAFLRVSAAPRSEPTLSVLET
jgi:hypothetical protein